MSASDRHAFMIMAHTDPIVLRTLVTLLDDDRNDIYLHVDARSTDIATADLVSRVRRAGVEVLAPTAISWGGFSQVTCELRLLERATRTPHAYYHLLSGADLPLVTQDALHGFFAQSPGTEYVHFVPGPLPDHVVRRIAVRRMFGERVRGGDRRSSSLIQRVERWSAAAQRRLLDTSSLPGLRWGSQWFSITDDLARYVLSRRSWIEQTFSRAVCPDEHFLQTLVAASPFVERLLSVAPEEDAGRGNARLIDWSRGDGFSPHVWRTTDLDILRKGPASGYVFARKFSSAEDLDVVMAIMTQAGSSAP